VNDLGWICAFMSPAPGLEPDDRRLACRSDELEAIYIEAAPTPQSPGSMPAVYKFAIIPGFNLMLHRRGKRHDPQWEDTALSMTPDGVRPAPVGGWAGVATCLRCDGWGSANEAVCEGNLPASGRSACARAVEDGDLDGAAALVDGGGEGIGSGRGNVWSPGRKGCGKLEERRASS
jgi:hypothetical protein